MNNKFYSARTREHLSKVNRTNKVKNTLTTLGLLCVPVLALSAIILDFVGAYRLSWLLS